MASMMQIMQNHSSEVSQMLNYNVLRMYLVFTFFNYSYNYCVTQNDFFMNLLDTLNLYQGGFGLDQQYLTPHRSQTSSIKKLASHGESRVLRTPWAII